MSLAYIIFKRAVVAVILYGSWIYSATHVFGAYNH